MYPQKALISKMISFSAGYRFKKFNIIETIAIARIINSRIEANGRFLNSFGFNNRKHAAIINAKG